MVSQVGHLTEDSWESEHAPLPSSTCIMQHSQSVDNSTTFHEPW